jgi:demethylmenaquinone methyltransferase/2-methoxy-6-polyprenyl-1,4-benzoquinol methylase
MSTEPTTFGSGRMFDAIAPRYDLLNRLISLGVDQRWRRKTVAALNLAPGGRALDLATGTADLALLIARTVPEIRIDGIDPSENMLDIGRRKVREAGLDDRVQLTAGIAEDLPFRGDEFDGTCIAFGIRNVPDRLKALKEMARVTRPGGRVAILELSEPRNGIVSPFARFHIHTVVPWMGSLLSGASEYRYLQRSIEAFPSPDEFARMMDRAGLNVLGVEKLTFGVCHLYVAEPRPIA